MDLQLKDKIVLITGGAKGIGAAVARTCAQERASQLSQTGTQQACDELHGALKAQGFASSFFSMELAPRKTATLSCRKRFQTSITSMPS